LDLGKLRKSISTISNHSWVKGYKKLTILSDYDKKMGLKFIITEEEKKHIRKLYENDLGKEVVQGFLDMVAQEIKNKDKV
jgi:hypothetical protein